MLPQYAIKFRIRHHVVFSRPDGHYPSFAVHIGCGPFWQISQRSHGGKSCFNGRRAKAQPMCRLIAFHLGAQAAPRIIHKNINISSGNNINVLNHYVLGNLKEPKCQHFLPTPAGVGKKRTSIWLGFSDAKAHQHYAHRSLLLAKQLAFVKFFCLTDAHAIYSGQFKPHAHCLCAEFKWCAFNVSVGFLTHLLYLSNIHLMQAVRKHRD